MRLSNEVPLPAAPDRVFTVINDVERVVPCLPGAALAGGSGDEYQGTVQVRVGPVKAAYRGTVRFIEVDADEHRLVLDARGTDQHGSGNASAKVTVQVRPHEDGSVLALDTDLVIRGKVAQFGRGAIGEISQKLMEQFARNLAGLLTDAPDAAATPGAAVTGNAAPPTAAGTAGAGRPGAAQTVAGAGQAVPATSGAAKTGASVAASRNPAAAQEASLAPQEDAGLNVLSLVAGPLLRRYAPVAAALAVGAVGGWLLGRRRGALLDDIVTATVTIGADRRTIPVRRTLRLTARR